VLDSERLKIKKAITKAAEDIIGYKTWKHENGFGSGINKYNWQ